MHRFESSVYRFEPTVQGIDTALNSIKLTGHRF